MYVNKNIYVRCLQHALQNVCIYNNIFGYSRSFGGFIICFINRIHQTIASMSAI